MSEGLQLGIEPIKDVQGSQPFDFAQGKHGSLGTYYCVHGVTFNKKDCIP